MIIIYIVLALVGFLFLLYLVLALVRRLSRKTRLDGVTITYIVFALMGFLYLLYLVLGAVRRLDLAGTTIIYIVVALVAFLFLFNWIGGLVDRLGLKTSLDDIDRFILGVMRGGHDATRLRLRVTGTKRYIDFVKVIPLRANTRFRMIVDCKACSRAELATAAEVLHGMAVDPQVEGSSKNGCYCLVVEWGQDVTRAGDAARAVFLQVMGVRPDAVLRAGMRGLLDVRPSAMVGWKKDNN